MLLPSPLLSFSALTRYSHYIIAVFTSMSAVLASNPHSQPYHPIIGLTRLLLTRFLLIFTLLLSFFSSFFLTHHLTLYCSHSLPALQVLLQFITIIFSFSPFLIISFIYSLLSLRFVSFLIIRLFSSSFLTQLLAIIIIIVVIILNFHRRQLQKDLQLLPVRIFFSRVFQV